MHADKQQCSAIQKLWSTKKVYFRSLLRTCILYMQLVFLFLFCSLFFLEKIWYTCIGYWIVGDNEQCVHHRWGRGSEKGPSAYYINLSITEPSKLPLAIKR